MNQKVLKTLEYYKIIDRLTDCAASEPGKKMCRELTPSSNFNEIVQTQTRDRRRGDPCPPERKSLLSRSP